MQPAQDAYLSMVVNTLASCKQNQCNCQINQCSNQVAARGSICQQQHTQHVESVCGVGSLLCSDCVLSAGVLVNKTDALCQTKLAHAMATAAAAPKGAGT